MIEAYNLKKDFQRDEMLADVHEKIAEFVIISLVVGE